MIYPWLNWTKHDTMEKSQTPESLRDAIGGFSMENQAGFNEVDEDFNSLPQIILINNFCEITNCSSKSEALFFLESHNFDLEAAVSTFFETGASLTDVSACIPNSPVRSQSEYSNSEEEYSPSRFRSPSPPRDARSYNLRSAKIDSTDSALVGGISRTRGGVRPLGDLNPDSKDEDSDGVPDFDPQEYYGEKSGMLVRDPSRANHVDAIFDQARQSGAVQGTAEDLLAPNSNFTGTGRLLSGEVPSTLHPPEIFVHNIIFWRNGFTLNNGPLRRLDDTENASFLESIKKSECPKELTPADRSTKIHVSLTRKDEIYQELKKQRLPFQGLGRTLGSTSELVTPVELNTVITALTSAPFSSRGLVIDETQPSTSVQLRLADGTRMIARFNNHHTIRDVRGFIDASRADVPIGYQLQIMGFPPKQLTDLDQTIDQAGIANSVVIQKL